MSLGPMEIILILAIVLIFFGPKRIPGLGKSLGEGIRGFKEGLASAEKPQIDASNKEQSEQQSQFNKDK